jgi:hypothetical protein
MFRRIVLTLLLFFVPASLAGAFQVPDTGITECYDADGNQIFPCPGPGEPYYGQDGNVLLNSMSFTDNGDGTLTDDVTALLWQKTADNTSRTWDDAVVYCDSLNSMNFGGHDSGWRLPALVELDSIMDLSVDTGTGAAAINPAFEGTAAAGYWTSTGDPDNSANAWIMDFGTTEDNTVAKSGTSYTRCVWGVAP